MATGNDEVCDMLSNLLILARIAEVAMTKAVEAEDKIDGQLGNMADFSQDLYAVAGNTSSQIFYNTPSLNFAYQIFASSRWVLNPQSV